MLGLVVQHVATLAERVRGPVVGGTVAWPQEIAIGAEVEPLRGAGAPERTSEYFVSEMMPCLKRHCRNTSSIQQCSTECSQSKAISAHRFVVGVRLKKLASGSRPAGWSSSGMLSKPPSQSGCIEAWTPAWLGACTKGTRNTSTTITTTSTSRASTRRILYGAT